jgi:hypothetical protein
MVELNFIQSHQVNDWSSITLCQPLKDFLIENNFATPANQIVIAFVPIILSIAFPLMIQTISKLNDRFQSTHIVKAFDSTFRSKFFKLALIFSVSLSIIGLIFSVEILLVALIFVLMLLISFFLYIDLMFKFLSANRQFLWYLKPLKKTFSSLQDKQSLKDFLSPKEDLPKDTNKPNRIRALLLSTWIVKKGREYIVLKSEERRRKLIIKSKNRLLKKWHPIINLFQYAIRHDDRELEYDIKDKYVYLAIQYIERVVHENQVVVEFPSEIHNSFFEVVRSYIRTGEKDRYQNIDEFVGSIFYSENYGRYAQFLHINTLGAIWRSLVLVIENKRWDVLEQYWLLSHQYFRYNFAYRLDRHYPEDKVMDQVSLNEMIERHQDQFLQIHLTIGAYLLHKREYATLKKLWNITQSEPPSYFLYPTTIGDVISYFGRYSSDRMNASLLRMSFKDMGFDEMFPNQDVKGYVCEYLGLVFLRLYQISTPHGFHPLQDLPVITKSQSEKQAIKGTLERFRPLIERILNNNKVMDGLGLMLLEQECEANSIQMPLEYIDTYISAIEKEYDDELIKAQLDEKILKEIDANTARAINDAFEDISRINNSTEIEKEDRDFVSNTMEAIRGTNMLMDKEALVENAGKIILNTTHLWAQAISRTYYDHFARKGYLQDTSGKYKVPYGHMFTAIDKLNPDPEQYSIITFAVNVEYLKQSRNLAIEPGIAKENFRYKGIPIYCFDYGAWYIHNSLYIIRNDHLPMVKHIDWKEVEGLSEETKARWAGMKPIDEPLHIYRRERILDDHPELRGEYLKAGKTEDELQYMVEIDIDFIAFIWFKKGTKLIRIKEADPFQEGGNMDSLDEIKPLND